MRIAVVGGGIFGCVTAVELARAGERVELYERRADILLAASACNQGRLHRGYHYPRARATAGAIEAGWHRWSARFPTTVDCSHDHYYGIAASGSLTDTEAYLAFLTEAGLPYDKVDPAWATKHLDLVVQVPEAYVNLATLREVLRSELLDAGVNMHVGSNFYGGGYDAIIDASYAHWLATKPRRYELCELALVELPPALRRMSLVVMDGAYCSIDPVPGTELHWLYDVHFSVHANSQGTLPELPANRRSAYGAMLSTARWFVKLPEVKYLTSRFTVRAVLPGVDATDERPTLVDVIFPGLIQVFPGKIDTALAAADEVMAKLGVRVAVC